MRTAAILCRNIWRLSSVASQGSSSLVSRVGRLEGAPNLLSSPVGGVESRGSGSALVQLNATSRIGSLRFMGFGTFNEEHADAALPDEKLEDEVEVEEHPDEAIERASHELFKQSNVIAYHEESPTNETEEYIVKDHSAAKPGADITSEICNAKELDGTSVFNDDSDKISSNA